MSADLVTRSDAWERGVRSVLLGNDRIAIEVVVDRGLDIAAARIRQVPIGWRSPTEIVGPWFIENSGFGPHRAFFGGLLTTCGLDHIGAPTERSAERFGYGARQREMLPMHGRASGIPARLLGYGVRSAPTGVQVFVEGQVSQVAVFGEHIVLTRTITLDFGSSTVHITDQIVNEGYALTPSPLLYHVNVGWPVVAPGAQVVVAGTVLLGDGDSTTVDVPETGRQERLWLHSPNVDDEGRATASIINPAIDENTAAGLRIRWETSTLPSLAQWNLANVAGHYAVALEPTTLQLCDDGSVSSSPELEPGESTTTTLELELLYGPAGSDFDEKTEVEL